MKLNRLFYALLLFSSLIVISHSGLYAQERNPEYLEDDGTTLWEEEKFLDATGQEFETDSTQYVGEEEVQAAEEAAKKSGIPNINIAAALEQDKEMMPDNIIYGIGTGAMLGGWFALVQGNDARENVRYLTVGILLGAGLGFLVGSKSLFLQIGPSASNQYEHLQFQKRNPFDTGQNQQKSSQTKDSLARIDFQFKF
ncbi:hypothetical protein KKA14_06430 [bacterium]|nr:hypothetical protein [bacterium]